MNNYYKNKLKTNNSKILYTQICTEKKCARLDVRLEPSLKKVIESICKDSGKSFSECTRLLWLYIAHKKGKLPDYKKRELKLEEWWDGD